MFLDLHPKCVNDTLTTLMYSTNSLHSPKSYILSVFEIEPRASIMRLTNTLHVNDIPHNPRIIFDLVYFLNKNRLAILMDLCAMYILVCIRISSQLLISRSMIKLSSFRTNDTAMDYMNDTTRRLKGNIYQSEAFNFSFFYMVLQN